MSQRRIVTAVPMITALAAVSASALALSAGPAQAAGECRQWGWPGAVVLLDNNNFTTLKFNSTGPNAGGPAEWINNQGKTVPGSITGSIDPNGAINLTHQDNNTEDAGFVGSTAT